ncbi:Membrane protein involved in the export of O-antigen and teichoic acid [Tenacibaculum sp. MAR_2010_89]|uniref:lipopolysaccharide biosynthesis protein n=1 Tax=Tenacibaculum sp. MAR_2010_89 TaxID=1250198 RepID=UPI00089A2C58|nr:hypothetical protein [Tenacibaculum sp. MAR_2010_89]SED68136.1 Membrane protein involved in the export of O-antigen and teichoic acid [Tenacibaculum sp. MAR_2010_89]
MKNAKKVIFNTGVLYFRLITGLVIGLLTTRLVLKALGETDYGIYMLVAGVVAILGILSSSMSNTSMRYMAHSLGSNDKKRILKTFNTTLYLHFMIGFIVVVFMIVIGLLGFKYLFNIPIHKVFEAKVVFGFMVVTTLVTIISVPYDAVMNAHENFLVLSAVDILGDILKFGIAIYLTYSTNNLLIKYGFLMLLVQVILRIIKQWYSIVKYQECKIKLRYFDKTIMKSITSFTGWNLLGSLGAMAVTQMRGVLLNMFFGVKLNAAEAISRSASTAVNMVSTNMTRAINPRLVKSEGEGDRKGMLYMTGISTRYSIFLFGLFAIPVFLEASYLLKVWLIDVPDFAVVFFQISIVTLLLEKFTFPITDAIRAIGDIREFQIIETILFLLNIPFAYVAFKLDYSPVAIYIIGVLISLFIFINRLYFGYKIFELSPLSFIKESILPILIPILIASIITLIPFLYIVTTGLWKLIIIAVVYMTSLVILFWRIGMQTKEKEKIKKYLFFFRNKITVK